MFTTVFSVTGAVDDSIPPLLWLVVARAGALLALALVFRLARRLVGPGWQGVAAGAGGRRGAGLHAAVAALRRSRQRGAAGGGGHAVGGRAPPGRLAPRARWRLAWWPA